MEFKDFLSEAQKEQQEAIASKTESIESAEKHRRRCKAITSAGSGCSYDTSYRMYNVPSEMSAAIVEVTPHLVYDTPFLLIPFEDEVYACERSEQRRNTTMGIIITGLPSISNHNSYDGIFYPKIVILENGFIGFNYEKRWYDNSDFFPQTWANFKPYWEGMDINSFYQCTSQAIVRAEEHLKNDPPKKRGLLRLQSMFS